MKRQERPSLNEMETNAFSANTGKEPGLVDEEEFAAELTGEARDPAPIGGRVAANGHAAESRDATGKARSEEEAGGAGWGMAAIALAIASWFIWPAVLAPAAVIAGVAAFVQGRRRLGAWSIALGIIAFILYLASTPWL